MKGFWPMEHFCTVLHADEPVALVRIFTISHSCICNRMTHECRSPYACFPLHSSQAVQQFHCMHAQCKSPVQNSALSQSCIFTKHFPCALAPLGLSLLDSITVPYVHHCKLPNYRVCRTSVAMQPLTQFAANTTRAIQSIATFQALWRGPGR